MSPKIVPTRLIVFMELVRGCNNTECPSWGTVCAPRKQDYMSVETLRQTSTEIKRVLMSDACPFEVIDIWAYGNGDALDHPELTPMLEILHDNFAGIAKLSMAIDSRRDIPKGEWWKSLDKIKMIHKIPESYDWIARSRHWHKSIPLPMSDKLITNRFTHDMWHAWKNLDFITELKAVPFHNIPLGTEDPVFTQRDRFSWEPGVPIEYGPYPGRPVRRSLIQWNGETRRCLVSPTTHKTIESLLLGPDDVCQTCWPLTGSELAKFYDDRIVITPSANCVSDGYFMPTWGDA